MSDAVALFSVFLFLAEDTALQSEEDLQQSETEDTAQLTDEEEFQRQLEENAANMGISVEEYTELLQNTMFRYYKAYMEDIVDEYKFGITLEELYELTIRELVGVDNAKLEQAFAAVFEGLDPNSQYFDAQTYASFTQKLDDSLVGVGIIVSNLEEKNCDHRISYRKFARGIGWRARGG